MTNIKDTLIQREKTHGDWEKQAELAQDLKILINSCSENLSANHIESLEMIAVKIARICCGNSNHSDHWHDIAGYAQLGKQSCKNKKNIST